MLYISHLEQAVKYEYLLIFYKCTLLNVKINIVLHYIYINWVWWRFIQQRVRAWENTSAACSLHSLLLQQSDTANSIPATVLFCHCVTLVTLHNSNSVVHVIVSMITLVTDVPCTLYVVLKTYYLFQPFSSFLYLTQRCHHLVCRILSVWKSQCYGPVSFK